MTAIRPPRPGWFTLLAVWMGWRCYVNFAGLLGSAPEWSDPASVTERFLAACAAVALGISAVALFRVERWAHRAVAAWALTALLRAFNETAAAGDGLGAPLVAAIFPGIVFLYVWGEVRAWRAAPAAPAAPLPARLPRP